MEEGFEIDPMLIERLQLLKAVVDIVEGKEKEIIEAEIRDLEYLLGTNI